MREKIGVGILLIITSLSALAQNPAYKFQSLTPEDGLINADVTVSIKDHQGFLWIGTMDGLNRYDGYEFKAFKHDFDDPNSLPENFIKQLLVDFDGDIWIGLNQNGLVRYDYDEERFIRVPYVLEGDTLYNLNCYALHLDVNNGLWTGTSAGALKYNREQDVFERINLGGRIHNVRTFANMPGGRMAVGDMEGGLFVYDEGEVRQFTFKKDGNDELIDHHIAQLAIRGNEIWFGNVTDGLFKYNSIDSTLRNYQKDNGDHDLLTNEISEILVDKSSNVWIGTVNGGLYQYRDNLDAFLRYTQNDHEKYSIGSNTVNSIYEDERQTLWFSTQFGGLNYLQYGLQVFEHYHTAQEKGNSLSNDIVGGFAEDEHGNIWVGTNDGLNKFSKGQFRSFTPDPTKATVQNHLVADQSGHIYIGAWAEGLRVFDIEKEIFTDISVIDEVNQLQFKSIKGLNIDHEGMVWLAVHLGYGLHIYDPHHQKYYYRNNPGPYPEEIFEPENVADIVEDSQNRIWIITYNGLFLYDRETFRAFKTSETNPSTISSDYVFTIAEGENDQVWVGSNKGLDRIDMSGALPLVERYGVRRGLPENVKGILSINAYTLWLSTNDGIIQLDIESGSVNGYSVINGLQGKNFKEKAVYKSRDGHLYFGGYNGFNRIHVDNDLTRSSSPKVVLTDFQVFNNSIRPGKNSLLSQSISRTNEIQLDYTHSVISFEYAGLNFPAHEDNSYAYRLDGFDENWHYVGDDRKATYTNLSPGEYVFAVKSANADGVWTEKGRSVRLVISPPFWQTWWFRSLSIMGFIIGLITFYKVRVYQLKRKQLELMKLVKIRTKEIEDQRQALEISANELSEANEELKTKNEMVSSQAEELLSYNDALNALNENLEKRVEERTNELVNKNRILADYSFINSHELRKPVSNILGLAQLFEYEMDIKDIKDVLNTLQEEAQKMDDRVRYIQSKLKQNTDDAPGQ